MASPFPTTPRDHTHYYEPPPRYSHYTVPIGGKLYTWGGRTPDFSDHSRRQLQSVVEIYDPYLEAYQQIPILGVPPAGLYSGACTAIGASMFVCCGYDGYNYHSALHQFDSTTFQWSKLIEKDPSKGPMRKDGCQMISYEDDKLALFGGYGIPIGPTPSGSKFIKDDGLHDGSGWSNELHLFHLKEGIWSVPRTTGDRPPPCADFSFTAIDPHRAVLFGGVQPGHGRVNDAYILDLQKMKWKKLPKSGDWPAGRSVHAACCINYGEQHPQLLISGGLDRDGTTLRDVWLLDVDSGTWKEVHPDDAHPRFYHTITAISLGPGLTEAKVFGGCSRALRGAAIDDQQAKLSIAETTVLQFESIEIASPGGGPPGKEWLLVGVGDKRTLGSSDRLREKMDKLQQRATATEEGGPATDRVSWVEGRMKLATKLSSVTGGVARSPKETKNEVEAMEQALLESKARDKPVQQRATGTEEGGTTTGRAMWDEGRIRLAKKFGLESGRVAQPTYEKIQEVDKRVQEVEKDVEAMKKALQESQARENNIRMEAGKSVQEANKRSQESERGMQEAVGQRVEAERNASIALARAETAEVQAAMVPTLEHTLQIRNEHIRRQTQEIDTQAHQLGSQDAQITQLRQQLDTTKKQKEVEMKKQQHQMDMKELEVLTLQYNLKGREEQVQRQQEEMRVQQEQKQEITVQRSQLQTEKQALTSQIKSLEKTLQVRMRETREAFSQTSEVPHPVSFQRPDTTQVQVAEVQQKLMTDQTPELESIQRSRAEQEATPLQQRHDVPIEEEAQVHQFRSQEVQTTAKDDLGTASNAIGAPLGRVREGAAALSQQYQMQEQIQEQHEHIQQQMEHITEVWKQVDKLQELVQRETEIQGHGQFQTTVSTNNSPTGMPFCGMCSNFCDHVSILNYAGYLRGTEVVAQRSFHLTSQACSFDWRQYGFKLHVPEGSLPPEMTQTSVDVRVSLSGHFKFPKGSDLVSATYWLSCPHKFEKPLDVELQHCASITDPSHCSKLSFVITKCTQEELPYTFKELEGGTFSQYSSYGRISLTHFSGLGIINWMFGEPQYCAQVYTRSEGDFKDWKVEFVITKDLEACLTVVQKQKHEEKATKDITFRIGFEEDIISLAVPEEGQTVGDWEITPRYQPTITKSNVDSFSSGKSISECVLALHWTKKDSPPAHLMHKIDLEGAKDNKYFKLDTKNPGAYTVATVSQVTDILLPMRSDGSSKALSQNTGLDSEPQLSDLINEVAAKIPNQWYEVGIQLKLEPNELSFLREHVPSLGAPLLFTIIFTMWKARKVLSYSWATIIEVLKTRSIRQIRLAEELEKKFADSSSEN